jgi:sugar/nucleoside kinase (ribokinase family)
VGSGTLAKAPDFLVIGHVVQDLVLEQDGSETWRLGGAASYASLLARNLGLRTATLTACSADLPLADLLPGIQFHRVRSERTTQMRNVYPDGGRREQWVPQRAETLTAEHLPEEWRDAHIVLLGPVAGEIDASLAGAFSKETLVGAGAQGWLREVGADSRVRPVSPHDWDAAAVLKHVKALFLSDEDLPLEDAPAALAEWSELVDVLAFTRGYGGADICYGGEWRRFDAYPADPIDLTGAGDTFAAGFLARYAETGVPWEATCYGACAASLVIEGVGVDGVPSKEAITERLLMADIGRSR